jgi:hypothetical protein
MPQQVNRDTYAIAKYFYWQAAYPEPAYHHKEIRDFYGVELSEFNRARTITGVFLQWLKASARGWVFFFSPALSVPLFLLARVARDRRTRFLVIAGLIGLLSSALVIFFNIHYLAPIAPVLLAVVVQGMRHLRLCTLEGKHNGRFLARAMVVVCIVMVPIQARLLASAPALGTWAAIGPERAAVAAQLSSLPGPHLVLVRYGSNHDPLLEWVYNGADIDRQKVVWARDMGEAQNAELLRYFSGRRVWSLDADDLPPKLMEYSVPRLANTAESLVGDQQTSSDRRVAP